MDILYEDNHLIAVNKQPSEIVQGDKTGDRTLAEDVQAYLKNKYKKPGNVFLGIIHRLDRPSSGVVLFARTSKALSRMNTLLREGNIKKIYWAVIQGAPPDKEGQLVHYMKKNEKQNKSYAVSREQQGYKEGKLRYSIIKNLDRYNVLEIDLITGRHHQIRAQLAAVDCFIKGDLKYGFKRSNPWPGIHLHARSVEFVHPVNKEIIRIEADPPADPLWDAVISG
jgi:23S rRNA pseudouridine1911/1915/1917 synthase